MFYVEVVPMDLVSSAHHEREITELLMNTSRDALNT